ncbi:hypothetical protein Plhal304r1_c003g0010861 [Plasmopara halstedii]
MCLKSPPEQTSRLAAVPDYVIVRVVLGWLTTGEVRVLSTYCKNVSRLCRYCHVIVCNLGGRKWTYQVIYCQV